MNRNRNFREKRNGRDFGKEENKPNDKRDNVYTAKVTERNGVISCSIEETNRIRLSLGLKPLNVEKKSNDNKEMPQKDEKAETKKEETNRSRKKKSKGPSSFYSDDDDEKSSSSSSLNDEDKAGGEKKRKEGERTKAFKKSKTGKRRTAKASKGSKSDSETDEDGDGEKDWFTKMIEGRAKFAAKEAKMIKKLEKKEKIEKKSGERETKKGREDGKHLQNGKTITAKEVFSEGLVVDFDGLDEGLVQNGKSITLTLAETDLFVRDPVTGKLKLSKEDDVFEHIEAAENRKAQRNFKRREKMKEKTKGTYVGDEDNSSEEEEKEFEGKERKKNKLFRITADGHLQKMVEGNQEEERLLNQKGEETFSDHEGEQTDSRAKLYYTKLKSREEEEKEEEVRRAFKKAKKDKKKSKKEKRKGQSRIGYEDEDEEEENGAKGGGDFGEMDLIASLEAELEGEGDKAIQNDAEDGKDNDDNNQVVGSKRKRKALSRASKDLVINEDQEEDPDLAASIERSRRLERLKRIKMQRKEPKEKSILEEKGGDKNGIEMDIEGKEKGNIFRTKDETSSQGKEVAIETGTTLFLAELKIKKETEKIKEEERLVEIKLKEEELIENGETSVDNDSKMKVEIDDDKSSNMTSSSRWMSPEEIEKRSQNRGGHGLPLSIRAMGPALRHFKRSGALKPQNPDDKEIVLEYVDKDGKVLSTKEQYKLFSQQFHGTQSGYKAQQKAKAKKES